MLDDRFFDGTYDHIQMNIHIFTLHYERYSTNRLIYLPGATNPGLAGLIVKSECTGEGTTVLITGGRDRTEDVVLEGAEEEIGFFSIEVGAPMYVSCVSFPPGRV